MEITTNYEPTFQKKRNTWLIGMGINFNPFFCCLAGYEIILSSRNSRSTTLDTLWASEFDYENHSCLNYAMQFNQTKLVSWQNIFRWQDTGWTQGMSAENTKRMGISMPIGLFGLDLILLYFFQNNITTIITCTKICEFFGGSMLEQWGPPEVHRPKAEVHHEMARLFLSSWLRYHPIPINLPQTMIPPLQKRVKRAMLAQTPLGLASEFDVLILKFYPSKVVEEDVPSGKLTWQWKITLLKMYSLLKMGMFHCYVSLPEGISFQTWLFHGIPAQHG